MELFILENIIENDQVDNMIQILKDKFNLIIHLNDTNHIQENNTKSQDQMFDSIKNLFKIEINSDCEKIEIVINENYQKIKSLINDNLYYHKIDIFNYIFAYKNIKNINYCNKIYDLIYIIYKINITSTSCIYSLRKNLEIISMGPYPNYLFKKFKNLISEIPEKKKTNN